MRRKSLIQSGVPNGIRTRVVAVKGRCPRPLDDGDSRRQKAEGRSQNGNVRHFCVLPSDLCLVVVSPVGIEPTTNWLKASCSTTELRARSKNRQHTDRGPRCQPG